MRRLLLLAVALGGAARAAEFEQEASIKEAAEAGRAAAVSAGFDARYSLDRAALPPALDELIERTAADYRSRYGKEELERSVRQGVAGCDARAKARGIASCLARVRTTRAERDYVLAAARRAEPLRALVEAELDAVFAELSKGRSDRGSDWQKTMGDHSIVTELNRRYPRSPAARRVVEEVEEAAGDRIAALAAARLPAAAASVAAEARKVPMTLQASPLPPLTWRQAEGALVFFVLFDEDQPRLHACSGPWQPYWTYLDMEWGYRSEPYSRFCVSVGLKDGVKRGTDAASSLANDRSDRVYRDSEEEFVSHANWDCVFLEASRRALASKAP